MSNFGLWSKRQSFLLLLSILVFGALLVPQLRQITLENNIELWLSQEDDAATTLARFRQLFPARQQVLVSWDGATVNDPRMASLSRTLRESTDLHLGAIRSVDSAADVLSRIERRGVDEAEATRRLQGMLIGRDQKSAGMLIALSSSNQANIPHVLDAIRSAAESVGIPPGDLHFGGEAVTSTSLDEKVRQATWNAVDPWDNPPVFMLCVLAGLLTSFWVLRSVRVSIIVMSAACITSALATSVVPLCGRTMNMVVVVMPSLLVVLTLSAGIHVVNYWRYAANGSGDAIQTSLRLAWRPCVLAAFTTGVGLLSLSISSLRPIQDFGLFSSLGILLSLAIVLAVVPAALRLLSPLPRRFRSSVLPFWAAWARGLIRHSRKVLMAGGAICLVSTLGCFWFHSDVRVIRYFPPDSKLVRDNRFLEQRVGGLATVELLVEFSEETPDEVGFLQRMELVRTITERVRQHPEVSGALSLADFHRKVAPPADDARTISKLRYRKQSHTTERRIKEGSVSGAERYLAFAAEHGGEWSHRDPLAESWRIQIQTYLLGDVDYGLLTNQLDRIVEEVVDTLPGASHAVSGAVPLFFRAQHALLQSLTSSLALAFGLIAGAMILLLRDVGSGVLCMIPNVMPIAIVFGLMSWSGLVFDIGTMLTASVALGVAVDGTLHMLNWFRTALERGRSRTEAVAMAIESCGPPLSQTTAVVGVSLMMLYPSQLLLISRFGWVMATLLGTAWITELVVLPALLLGKLGRRIERQTLSRPCRKTTAPIPKPKLLHHGTSRIEVPNQNSDASRR